MKVRFPHTYVIIFSLIILSAVLTWIIPGGKYAEEISMVAGEEVKQLVFQPVESQPQTWQVFGAMFKGFERQAGIIVFILMIGGAFWIMNATKALDVGIISFISYTRGFERYKFFRIIGVDNVVITLIMLMFSLFGAIFGMSEETIAFVIILVPLAISMGYDSIVGVAMCYLGAHIGFAGAMLNPFTIGIAQGIAGLPLFSGLEYRFICWVIFNITGIGFVLWYAHRIRKRPERSPMHVLDVHWRTKSAENTETIAYNTPLSAWISFGLILVALILFSVHYPMTELKIGTSTPWHIPAIPIATGLFALAGLVSLLRTVHYYILNLLLFTIVFLIIGVMGYHWYIMEIAALFFAMGLASGLAMGYGGNRQTSLFLDGARDIVSAALIVGLAGGIIVILEDGKVIDTILYRLASSLHEVGQIQAVGTMYFIQNVINIIIPSGSAKAALTMPIMAPFSDLINLSRQATVMAFQFGDGITNMITPTSGVLIGALGIARIPYDKWVKWIWPLILTLFILGFLLLIPTVTMKLNGF
ncbi:MAG: AbgT family transporter [Bacteroidales bacterium]|nr:AbgT family transporter [Bacteroidales bacterium]